MLKTIRQPGTNKTFKMGRNRPSITALGRGWLNFAHYKTAALPAPPPGPLGRAKAATKSLFNIYGNDSLGDCVIAGMGHVQGVLTGNAGDLHLYSLDKVISEYSAIGGYVPGDPSTDRGCDEITALNYWQHNGFVPPWNRIAGWLAVNGADPVECRTALWLFENLYFGVELPDSWVNPMPQTSGFTWDVAGPADPQNGHCVCGIDYFDSGPRQGIQIATWGMLGVMTTAAVAAYTAGSAGGALYTVLSPDSINRATQRAPNGLDWQQLQTDFQAMSGGA
jgi:hypothetical protein